KCQGATCNSGPGGVPHALRQDGDVAVRGEYPAGADGDVAGPAVGRGADHQVEPGNHVAVAVEVEPARRVHGDGGAGRELVAAAQPQDVVGVAAVVADDDGPRERGEPGLLVQQQGAIEDARRTAVGVSRDAAELQQTFALLDQIDAAGDQAAQV